jgi:hypothetical protein
LLSTVTCSISEEWCIRRKLLEPLVWGCR